MNIPRLASLSVAALLCAAPLTAADYAPAARSINEFGLQLHLRLAAKEPGGNLCTSPFSIQTALAMTFAGADGETRDEMAKVLHLDGGDKVHGAFAALEKSLADAAGKSATLVKDAKKNGGPSEPLTLTVANRLYGQESFEFRKPFLGLLSETYRAPFEEVNFISESAKVRKEINGWVEKQTKDRIKELIPPDGVDSLTRLVLVNAVYLKAPWADEFSTRLTSAAPFQTEGSKARKVPTMQREGMTGYAKHADYRAISLPYVGEDLQFLILLPDKANGLGALEKSLTAADLAKCASLPQEEIFLHLPKFKFEPPTVSLKKELVAMGMKTAFDQPGGSANFDRMAPRTPQGYLAISQVFHKTFIALDERGTEAAAATAVAMMYRGVPAPRKEPVEVKVDHPFLFAIQHKASGACLFLGRVTNP